MKRDRAYKRSMVWFALALVPLVSTALMGRPGAGGATLLAVMIGMVAVYELVRGAE